MSYDVVMSALPESQPDQPTRVGIRELKANLSAFVKRAAAGETIVVTDRGTPTVRMIPEPVRRETAFERGVREGWIRPGITDLELARRPPDPVPRRPGAPSLEEIRREDREDRF